MTRTVRIEVPTPYFVGPVNVWLLKGDACVLIDSGLRTPEARAALEAGLKKEQVRLEDIEAILVTHGHPDHFGLAREMRERTGAKVYAHAEEQHVLEGYPESHRRILGKFAEAAIQHGYPAEEFGGAAKAYHGTIDVAEPAPVDRVVQDGEFLEFGDIRLQAIHTPGHTKGSTCFYRDAELFTGDTVLEHITPVTFLRIGLYRESLERLKRLDVRTAYPGHRGKFDDFGGAIRRAERHLDLRAKRILAAMDGPKTAYEIAQAAFPRNEALQRWVSFAETLGLLGEMEERGTVRRIEEGTVRFRRP